jgi:3-hydroxy-3-methylglutaryl CoA synthase
MHGITAYCTYLPRYRLPRDIIAQEWGHASLGGERAVANHDEDSLTMAINAAVGCALSRKPEVILFASTTPPYREKQSAATIAAVLDAIGEARTTDLTGSLRAGTSAILAGLDALAGGAHSILVGAADCRLGEPDSMD